MAATILPQAKTVFLDANQNPLVGGFVYFYIPPNTTTLKTTWQDANQTIPNTNPVVLDGQGSAYIYGSGQYLQVLKDSSGNLIWSGLTQDVSGLLASANTNYTGNNNFLGTTTAVTQPAGDNSNQLATDAFVQTALLTGSRGGYINKFRNGAMDVAQRGTTSSITTGVTSYSVDGWQITPTGATVTWSQVYGSIAGFNANFLKLQGAASMTDTWIRQRIESTICAPLAGTQVTIQFFVSNSTSSIMSPTLTVRHATAQDNWAGTVTDVAAAALTPIAVAGTTTLAYTYAAPLDSSNGIEVLLDFGGVLSHASDFVYVTYADIRTTPSITTGINTTPPPPEVRPIATEIPFNQRYFSKSFNITVAPVTQLGANSAGVYSCPVAVGASSPSGRCSTIFFPVSMRSTPTITLYNTINNNAQPRDQSAGADCSSAVTAAVGNGSFYVGWTNPGSANVGDAVQFHWSATSEL